MKKLIAVVIALAMILGISAIASAVPAAGTTLTADVTLNMSLEKTFQWTIDKSVTPAQWHLFKGDKAISRYTVSVAKTGSTDVSTISGVVNVTNAGVIPTQNLIIKLTIAPTGGSNPAPLDPPGVVTLDLGANAILAAGETHAYPYSLNIAGTPGTEYKVTADITITNHSGSLDIPKGPSPSATATCPVMPTKTVNESIDVDDTNGMSWAFSDSGSVSYDVMFDENAKGVIDNTATIRQTGQNDSASVRINRYNLGISKTAATTYLRKYDWTIDKTGDQTLLYLAVNQNFPVNYTVTVDNTYKDSGFAASGVITIHNPSPIAAVINSATDIMSDNSAVTLDASGYSFPYTLAAGASMTMPYSVTLPDAAERTNTATAVLQNHLYSYDESVSLLGTTSFSGTAKVAFGDPSDVIDESITVNDDLYGYLGIVNANEAPKTFQYMMYVGPYSAPGMYRTINTATLKTNDTGTEKSDNWTVTVIIKSSGYTLTIGYWKNHAGLGPQKDMLTPLLPITLGNVGGDKSVTIGYNVLAVKYLKMSGDSSNGINKLYAQMLAAKLNIMNGADDSAVATAITEADNFLAKYNAASWTKLSSAQKNQVLAWATLFDKYNNGIIGPGHADQ